MKMSSFKKREKALRRTHKERGQPASRRHLGLLEKHKDYVLRARDYHQKQAQLKILHEKARNRNPDEFYYKMVHSKLKDGRHVITQSEDECSEEQKKIMQTQDIKYIQLKLSSEKKKVERLQSSLHLLDQASSSQQNTHTIFVDTAEEMVNFDPVEHFQTVPELVNRKYNRPHVETLQQSGALLDESIDQGTLEHLSKRRNSRYRELNERIKRCQELRRVEQKMHTQKHLLRKEKHFRIPGDGQNPTTYRWVKERKR